MADVPVSKAGAGSAMNDTTRELGGALGVAVLVSIMNRAFPGQPNQLVVLRLLPEKVYETISSGIEGAHQFASFIPFPKIQDLFLGYVNEAFVTGMNEAMLAGAMTVVFAALISYYILPKEIQRAKEELFDDVAQNESGRV